MDSNVQTTDDQSDLELHEQVEAQLIIGEEYSRSGDSKSALAAFNKAISLDPACDMAWFNRGVLLESQQDARGARQAFQICLDVNPNHAPATANLCILLERIGDISGAYKMAIKALDFYPGHPSLTEVKQRCQGEQVSKSIETMQVIESSDSFSQEDMDVVMEETGITNQQTILAEAVYHDTNEDQNLDIDELRSAAEVVVATEEIEEIIETAQPVVQSIPDKPVLPVVQEISVDMDKIVNEATELVKNGDAKGALKLLKPHLKTTAAEHAPSWLLAGGAMARLELDEHAISALEHALKLDPTNPKGWFNLGSIKQRRGENLEASTCYANAVREDPTYLKAALKWAPIARQLKQPEAYLTAATIIIQMDPDNDIKMELITTLIELAEGESQVLESSLGIPPTLPEGPELAKTAFDLLGDGQTELHARAHTQMNSHVHAVKIWKELIQTHRNDHEMWRGLSKALYAAGDTATAEKCSIKANEIEQINQQRTNGEQIQNIPEESIHQPIAPVIDQTITQQPSQEEQTAANDVLLQPIERQETVQPESQPNPQVDLAKAALDVQNNSLVAEDFRNPSSMSVANQDISWYNQGVALIEAGKYKEALSCFDRALPSFSNDDEMVIRILNGRGNAFYYLENYPACVESYHQAMLIRPEDVRGKTLYNMGTAYAEMERFTDAIKCFEQAIPRGLTKEEIKRTKDQIRRCNILLKEQKKKNR